MNGLAQHQREWGSNEPVDFIFDERPEKEKNIILDAWNDVYCPTAPDDILAVTGKQPVFANDEQVLPLQAADMSAWRCRKMWIDNDGMIPGDSFPIPWGKVGDIAQMILDVSTDTMNHIPCHAAQVVKAHPQ